MTLEDRHQLEQIGYTIDNCGTLAATLAASIAETSKQADGMMALAALLVRLASEIGTVMARQAD